MYYGADGIERALTCSFCKEKFDEEVKLIPECGNCICGRCYANLRRSVADTPSNGYRCERCDEEHVLSWRGLPDCLPLIGLLQSLSTRRPLLSERATALRAAVSALEEQMERLTAFDGAEMIGQHCDQLELEVCEAVESGVNQLNEIGRDLLKQIDDYRHRCLASMAASCGLTQQRLEALRSEIAGFCAIWNSHFSRIDAFAGDESVEVEAALAQADAYGSHLALLKERLTREALLDRMMVFKPGSLAFRPADQVGEIRNLADQEIRIDETPSLTLAGHPKEVLKILFLPDGRLASTSNDETIRVWNVETGEELFVLRGHRGTLSALVSLPRARLASGCYDRTVKIWDLAERRELRTLRGHTGPVVGLCLMRNGRLASYSIDDTVRIWNSYSKTGECLATLSGHGNTFWTLPFFGVLSSNDGLVTCSSDKHSRSECCLRLWSPATSEAGALKSVATGLTDVWSLLVLANDQVALGCIRGAIKIVDLADETLTRLNEEAHHSWVFALAQLSNGNLVSCGKDGAISTLKIWRLLDLSPVQTVNTCHSHFIRSLSVSPDERFLASASWDKTTKVWLIHHAK